MGHSNQEQLLTDHFTKLYTDEDNDEELQRSRQASLESAIFAARSGGTHVYQHLDFAAFLAAKA